MKSVSEMWHSADEVGKIALLKIALDRCVPLHEDLLRETISNIDRLTRPLGFQPVRVAVVDMAGMRDTSDGVVNPKISTNYKPRQWTSQNLSIPSF